MNDLDWLSARMTTAALEAAHAPRDWLARLADAGLGLEALARAAGTIGAFRRRPPLGEVDPLAALGRAPAAPAVRPDQVGDEVAERAAPPAPAHRRAAGSGDEQPAGAPPAARRRARGPADPEVVATHAAQTLPADRLHAIAHGRDLSSGARAAKLPAWARSNGRPERSRAQVQDDGATPPARLDRRLPATTGRAGRAQADVSAALAAALGTATDLPPETLPADATHAPAQVNRAAQAQRGPAGASAGGALLDRLARAAARAIVSPGEGEAPLATTLAGALDAPVHGPALPAGILARLAALGVEPIAAPSTPPAPDAAREKAGRPEAPAISPSPAGGARGPAIPRPRVAGAPPAGEELLRAALRRYEAAAPSERAPGDTAPGDTAPAPRPVAPAPPAAAQEQGEAPPAAPAVQNTFNVTVHMGRGADEPDDDLAERLTRILVEQARRNGIDV
jgi:hypothetical protein